MDETKVSALIGTIYNSAYEEDGWDRLQQILRTQFHASQICTVGHNWTRDSVPFGATTADPTCAHRYLDYYHKIEPVVPIYRSDLRRSRQLEVFHSELLTPREDFLRSEFYQDYQREYDMCLPLVGMLHISDDEYAHFLVMRPAGKDQFTGEEFQLLKALRPHLNRSLRLYLELGELRGKAGLFDAAFDQLAASFLLDASGRVLGLNTKAEALLADGGGPLMVTDGRLIARHASDAAKFTAALAPPAPGAPPPDLVIRGLTASLRLSVTPVNGGDIPLFFDVTPTAKAAFLVTAQPLGPSLQNLMTLYRLTRAEAEITLLLLDGARAQQIAAHRETSIGTVNTQIKQIYAKTGADGLVALILKLLGR